MLRSERFITIDPGRVSGVCLFEERQLIDAWHVNQESLLKPVIREGAELALLEMPVSYPHTKVDPNDLIKCVIPGAFIAGAHQADIRCIKPAQWKGQVPKKIMNNRVWESLNQLERRIVDTSAPKRHQNHVLDAAGIGLWALGRLS